jgi:predicted RNase H-like HicB family nuclease
MAYVTALIHHEANVYGISFPDFPGCISTADSIEEVIRRGEQALALHVEGMVEDGEALPVLRRQHEILGDETLKDEISGATFYVMSFDLPGKAVRINITMDENLLGALDRAARDMGASRSGYLADAVRAKLLGR